MDWQSNLSVPEAGCGYADIQLATGSRIQGVVVNRQGKPAAKIPVWVEPTGGNPKDGMTQYPMSTTTDVNGGFAISGLPDADVCLSAGVGYPTTAMPYGRVYYPAGRSRDTATVFRLKPGDHHPPVVLILEEALARGSVRVRVLHKDGKPGVGAVVDVLDGEGFAAEFANTDANGVARVPCLRGLRYELEAQTFHQRMPSRDNILKSSRSPFICGDFSAEFTLVLDHSAPD